MNKRKYGRVVYFLVSQTMKQRAQYIGERICNCQCINFVTYAKIMTQGLQNKMGVTKSKAHELQIKSNQIKYNTFIQIIFQQSPT